MIVIEAILINNGYSPKETPNNVVGSCFDGEKFIFFESEEERIKYLDELIKNQPIEDEIVE